jgi:hypothetical protein
MNFGVLGFELGEQPMESVRVLTLDEIAPPDTRLVKIDVEGFEPQVLAGAPRLLARRETIWLAEASSQHPQAAAETIRLFQDAGYGVYWFYAPFVTRNPVRGPTPLGARGDPNVVALPPGVANAWRLPPVGAPGEQRPGNVADYPYLARYGFT